MKASDYLFWFGYYEDDAQDFANGFLVHFCSLKHWKETPDVQWEPGEEEDDGEFEDMIEEFNETQKKNSVCLYELMEGVYETAGDKPLTEDDVKEAMTDFGFIFNSDGKNYSSGEEKD